MSASPPSSSKSSSSKATTSATPAPRVSGLRQLFATKPGVLPPKPTNFVPPPPQPNSAYVFAKLMFFMVLLAGAPLWSYYKALADWFPGDTSLAALTAVAAANLVVLLYVLVASLEEDDPKPKPAAAPKQRTVADAYKNGEEDQEEESQEDKKLK
ncbi:hypothetical protein BC828DRAFT_372956 [Blastocladiella britannica]|nr:hypothetical protein BC828DRAFT_372956 [Blastocladiella britannica]